MGMYTEFIFGCSLSKNTPKICIDALDYVINGKNKKLGYEKYNKEFIERTSTDNEIQTFINEYDFRRLFCRGSYYFGAPVSKELYYDYIDKTYKISTRANLKNYQNQIEKFIEYIKPYVVHGSGYDHHIFAYVQYEEDEFPTIYGTDGIYKVNAELIKPNYDTI